MSRFPSGLFLWRNKWRSIKKGQVAFGLRAMLGMPDGFAIGTLHSYIWFATSSPDSLKFLFALMRCYCERERGRQQLFLSTFAVSDLQNKIAVHTRLQGFLRYMKVCNFFLSFIVIWRALGITRAWRRYQITSHQGHGTIENKAKLFADYIICVIIMRQYLLLYDSYIFQWLSCHVIVTFVLHLVWKCTIIDFWLENSSCFFIMIFEVVFFYPSVKWK